MPQCLDSARECADEIVLVDTGSEDRTVEIAKSFGARVLHQQWCDDFAAARNTGIDAAAGDWILCLDADERLTGGNALRPLIAATPARIGGYVVARHDVAIDRDSGRTVTHTVGSVRLFRRHSQIRYVGAVHERPGETVLKAGFDLSIAQDVLLTHYLNWSPPEVLDAKQRRYLKLLDRELAKDPADPWFRYYRGKTHWYLSRCDAALKDFTAVETSARAYLFLRASAASMRGLLLAERGQIDKAIRAASTSLQIFSRQSLAHYVAGEILYRQGDFIAAARQYRRVRLSLGGATGVAAVHGDYYFLPERQAYKLGCCYLALGKLERARRAFGEGLRANNRDAGCHFGLALVERDGGDCHAALRHATAAAEYDPGWREAVRLRKEITERASIKCAS